MSTNTRARRRNRRPAQARKERKERVPLPRKGMDSLTPKSEMVQVSFGRLVTFNNAVAAQDYFFFTNAPVKPDLNSSTQPTGWQTVEANRYAFGRVLSYSYTVTFAALGAKPAIVWTYESNEDPTGSSWQDQLGNPFFQQKQLTTINGKGNVSISGRRAVQDVVGAAKAIEVLTSPDYQFVTVYSAGPPEKGYPPDLTYLGFGVQTLDGSNLSSSGVVAQVKITYLCRVYDRHLQ